MTKKLFLKTLREALENKDYPQQEIREILDDYAMMIDEALERGEDEASFITKLGDPKSIAKTISKEIKLKDRPEHKLIALSPFIAIIIFFYSGFAFNAWHPAWMAFLLIPVTAIIIEVKNPFDKLIALSPFIALTGFMLLGTYYGLWHPMWALFLIIPGLAFLQSRSWILKLAGLYTFLAMIAFIVYTIIYEPTHFYAFIILLPIPIMGILSGQITIIADFKSPKSKALLWLSVSLLIIMIATYIYIGVSFSLWHPTWLMFLLIPLIALIYTQFVLKEPVEIVAYTPFIAVIIFVLWGYFGNAYQYSWLVFLLIPITAILFSKENIVEIERTIDE